jgi:hypothetical protein
MNFGYLTSWQNVNDCALPRVDGFPIFVGRLVQEIRNLFDSNMDG